jgi:hypothetical protein
MLKLLLMSVIIATLVVPLAGARVRDPRRALRFVVSAMGLTFVGYGFFLMFVYARLL